MADDTDVTPGYTTTEFWVTIGGVAANLVAVLVALGKITPETGQQLTDLSAAAIAILPAVVGNIVLLWKYINSRVSVKADAALARTQRYRIDKFAQTKERIATLNAALEPVLAPAAAKAVTPTS